MKDYDIVVTKVYEEYMDYRALPYEYHLVVRDLEKGEDAARVKIAGPIWRQLFGEETH